MGSGPHQGKGDVTQFNRDTAEQQPSTALAAAHATDLPQAPVASRGAVAAHTTFTTANDPTIRSETFDLTAEDRGRVLRAPQLSGRTATAHLYQGDE